MEYSEQNSNYFNEANLCVTGVLIRKLMLQVAMLFSDDLKESIMLHTKQDMADVRAKKEAYAIALTRFLPFRIAESRIVLVEYPLGFVDFCYRRFLYTIAKTCRLLVNLYFSFTT